MGDNYKNLVLVGPQRELLWLQGLKLQPCCHAILRLQCSGFPPLQSKGKHEGTGLRSGAGSLQTAARAIASCVPETVLEEQGK